MSITSRSSNFSKWYNDIVQFANLAESSPVRGCMIVKPYGYAIWENIQTLLDKRFKETGHNNAYFPMFIPLSYFSKEASHVSGFAKECAVVTHYRLKEENNTVIVDPTAKLENELIVRPTSETIIWSTIKNWIRSYRDLPLKLNQWCNVCRWEMRNRPFLRTSEFLWQEGHTAHTSYDEALQEAKTMLQIYDDIGRDYLAIPFLKGVKTEHERFAGADITFTIEALMQDGKALQSGTSHLLGQHFAKAFDVKYTDQNGEFKYVWGTSWGMSTRILGALIMTHSDDKGLVLPPKIAPTQVVIIPIYKTDDELAKAIQYVNSEIIPYLERAHIRVKFDNVDGYRPSEKFEKYELMGVPIRLVVGPRDINNKTCEFYRRDTFEKNTVNVSFITDVVLSLINEIHNNLYDRALKFRQSHTVSVDTYEEFCKAIEDKSGFVLAHWDGTTETEQLIQQETKATIRCILLDEVDDCCGKCIKTGQPSKQRVVFAQAY